MMAGVDEVEVEVVVAHAERATLRVGDVFVKIDADQTRTDVEVEAMALAPVPTPEVLWRKPPVLALAALAGTALGHLGEPSAASSAAWSAAGAAVRTLHDAPLPRWPGRSVDDFAGQLDGACEWLIANDVLAADVVTRNRRLAESALAAVDTGVHPRRPAGRPRLRRRRRGHRRRSTGPRRPRATRSSTSPRSRSDTRSTSATSSPATAPTSTAT